MKGAVTTATGKPLVKLLRTIEKEEAGLIGCCCWEAESFLAYTLGWLRLNIQF